MCCFCLPTSQESLSSESRLRLADKCRHIPPLPVPSSLPKPALCSPEEAVSYPLCSPGQTEGSGSSLLQVARALHLSAPQAVASCIGSPHPCTLNISMREQSYSGRDKNNKEHKPVGMVGRGGGFPLTGSIPGIEVGGPGESLSICSSWLADPRENTCNCPGLLEGQGHTGLFRKVLGLQKEQRSVVGQQLGAGILPMAAHHKPTVGPWALLKLCCIICQMGE